MERKNTTQHNPQSRDNPKAELLMHSEIGVAIPLSHYVFQGVANYRNCTSFVHVALPGGESHCERKF